MPIRTLLYLSPRYALKMSFWSQFLACKAPLKVWNYVKGIISLFFYSTETINQRASICRTQLKTFRGAHHNNIKKLSAYKLKSDHARIFEPNVLLYQLQFFYEIFEINAICEF